MLVKNTWCERTLPPLILKNLQPRPGSYIGGLRRGSAIYAVSHAPDDIPGLSEGEDDAFLLIRLDLNLLPITKAESAAGRFNRSETARFCSVVE
jgi:hypothetical protein